VYQPEEDGLKSPIVEHLEVSIRTSCIRRIGITCKSFLKMPPPPNFCPGCGKGTVKDARFCCSCGIGFDASGPSASGLEAPVAVRSTRPADDTGANPSDVPTALKSINLAAAATDAGLSFMNNYLAKSTVERVSTRP
jgi:hypothetical protein